MTAFPYNEPAPTAGSWFWLCATCGRRDNTDLTKSVKTKLFVDDSGHSYTQFFFFAGKTGPVSSLSRLTYSFRFPIYSLWLSLVGWCSYWWKPGQENDPGEYFFLCPPSSEKGPICSCARVMDEKRNHGAAQICDAGRETKLHFLK